jgi:hypothetical protein
MPADVFLHQDKLFCVNFKSLLYAEAFRKGAFKVEVLGQIFVCIMDIANKLMHLVSLTCHFGNPNQHSPNQVLRQSNLTQIFDHLIDFAPVWISESI